MRMSKAAKSGARTYYQRRVGGRGEAQRLVLRQKIQRPSRHAEYGHHQFVAHASGHQPEASRTGRERKGKQQHIGCGKTQGEYLRRDMPLMMSSLVHTKVVPHTATVVKATRWHNKSGRRLIL